MTTTAQAGLIWLNTQQAADRAGCHRQTAIKALEAGELHGSQRKAGGRWRIHVDCLDAWAGGEPCKHQVTA
jgi:excisionase family DNA binding protein